MFQKRIIPILLIDKNGGLVKTKRFKNRVYIGDPINAVKIFNDKFVDEIIVLDIDATPESYTPKFDLIQEIASEAFIPIAYGGGIKSLSHAEKLIDLGIEKVILNSQAIINPKLISSIAKKFGNQSVVVSIDVSKDIFGRTILKTAGNKYRVELKKHINRIVDAGAGEVMVTNVKREGTKSGYDLDIIQRVIEHCNVPVIANGGAGNIQHFKEVFKIGATGAAAGSLFVFSGETNGVLISYPSKEELKIIHEA